MCQSRKLVGIKHVAYVDIDTSRRTICQRIEHKQLFTAIL
jgi:hypothetical protein